MNSIESEVGDATSTYLEKENGEIYSYIRLSEVPDGSGDIQITNPRKEIYHFGYEGSDFDFIPIAINGMRRCCNNDCGCKSENRNMAILINEVEAEKLRLNIDNGEGSLDTINIVELHHSIQLYIGKENLPIRGRKYVKRCYINHDPETENGGLCFPRAYKIDNIKTKVQRISVIGK